MNTKLLSFLLPIKLVLDPVFLLSRQAFHSFDKYRTNLKESRKLGSVYPFSKKVPRLRIAKKRADEIRNG